MQVAGFEGGAGWLEAVRRAVLVAGIIVLLAACAPRPFPPEPQPQNRDVVVGILTNAYEKVSENSLYRLEVGDLAVAGLASLQRLEPGFSLQSDGDVVALRWHDQQVYTFSKPPSGDIDAWANSAADMLIAAEKQVAALRAHSGNRVFETHMEGIAGSLRGGAEYLEAGAWREVLMPQYDGGIILTFRWLETGLEVWRLDPDGRLATEGLRKGDVITHIDFESVEGLKGLDVYKRIMGPPGSSLSLTVLRGDPTTSTDLRVTRWKTEQPSYRLVRRGDIAVLQLPYMNSRAVYDLIHGIDTELRRDRYGQRPLEGFVLDLRGTLDAADMRDLANAFLGKGVVSVERDYKPRPKRVINASWPDHSDNLPLIVLVDGGTGQSPEEVAAALQDNGRAIVIGSSTAGEGIVRRNISLFNMGDIWMPVARAYAPSGYGIAGRGVLPHICTSLPEASLENLMPALRRGEGVTAAADRTRHIDPEDSDALKTHRALCPPVADESDLALQLALAILNEPGLYTNLLRQ